MGTGRQEPGPGSWAGLQGRSCLLGSGQKEPACQGGSAGPVVPYFLAWDSKSSPWPDILRRRYLRPSCLPRLLCSLPHWPSCCSPKGPAAALLCTSVGAALSGLPCLQLLLCLLTSHKSLHQDHILKVAFQNILFKTTSYFFHHFLSFDSASFILYSTSYFPTCYYVIGLCVYLFIFCLPH